MSGLPESTCWDYDDHRGERVTYEDAETTNWECTVCGAEWWTDK